MDEWWTPGLRGRAVHAGTGRARFHRGARCRHDRSGGIIPPASVRSPTHVQRPLSWGRSLLFASGDFACNLYWQSITFYLLFFYTDTLGLSAAVAGLITMLASVWDGIAGLVIGVAADRRSARAFVRWNAVP